MSDTENTEYVAPEKEPQPAVTGRPNDTPVDDPAPAPLGGNSTFADRAKQRQKDDKKQVDADAAEDKQVTSAATKTRGRKK